MESSLVHYIRHLTMCLDHSICCFFQCVLEHRIITIKWKYIYNFHFNFGNPLDKLTARFHRHCQKIRISLMASSEKKIPFSSTNLYIFVMFLSLLGKLNFTLDLSNFSLKWEIRLFFISSLFIDEIHYQLP